MKTRLALLGIWLLCQLSALVAAVWMLFAIAFGSHRAFNIAIAYDELGNAATGGKPKQTISARAALARGEGQRWGCILCRLLDWVQKDHCKNSLESDRGEQVTTGPDNRP